MLVLLIIWLALVSLTTNYMIERDKRIINLILTEWRVHYREFHGINYDDVYHYIESDSIIKELYKINYNKRNEFFQYHKSNIHEREYRF